MIIFVAWTWQLSAGIILPCAMVLFRKAGVKTETPETTQKTTGFCYYWYCGGGDRNGCLEFLRADSNKTVRCEHYAACYFIFSMRRSFGDFLMSPLE